MMRPTASLLFAGLVACVLAQPAVAATPRSAIAEKPGVSRVAIGVEPGRESAVAARLRLAGLDVRARGRGGRYLVVEATREQTPGAIAASMAGESGVSFAEPEHVVRAAYVPTDLRYDEQWALPRIGMPSAWDLSLGSPDVVVAVIDTGVDYLHPELVGQVDTANDIDFANNDTDARDDHGHGTHVAGIIAAKHNGVGVAGIAPGVRILPIKALDSDGGGNDIDVAAAIDWAAAKGADVINISLGGTDYPSVIETAIDGARTHGVIVVAASGNTPGTVPFYPAALPGVVGVSATTSTDGLASFSSYGPSVDLGAPGVDILSSLTHEGVPLLFEMSGTSMASPHVTGAVALVKSAHPDWDEAQVLSAIAATAHDAGPAGRDDRFGFGRLNVAGAVSASPNDDALPGVVPVNSPVFAHVDAADDPRDRYAVDVPAGAQLDVAVSSAGSEPVAVVVTGPDGSVIESRTPSVGHLFTLAGGNIDGTCSIEVSTAGSTAYTLDWGVRVLPTITATGPATVGYGGTATVTGVLQRPGSSPVSFEDVAVYARPYGGAWSRIATFWTDSAGRYTARVKPTSRTEYRFTFKGSEESLPVTSGTLVITPRAYLTAPSVPSSVIAGRSFTSTGSLKPRHSAGGRDVKISCYRLENGSWKLRRTVYATNANYSSYTKYSAKFSLAYRGKWRLHASVKGDTKHAATSSSYRYVTVK
jgi:subtilisin family serine protease